MLFALQSSTATGAHSRRGQTAQLHAVSVAGSLARGPARVHCRRTAAAGVSEIRTKGERAPLLHAQVSLPTSAGGAPWVHIFDMQNSMCIIHELCVAWCRHKHIGGFFLLFFFLLFCFLYFYLKLCCVPRCDHVRITIIIN